MDENLTPTPADQWQGALAVAGSDLKLPSGNVARVRQISPVAFLDSDMIPDPLTKVIRESINEKSGMPPKKMKEISDDPKMLSSTLELFDRVLAHVVVMPDIQMPPACDVALKGKPCGQYANQPVHESPTKSGHHAYHEGEREPGVLYADMVDMQDKMFIFNWALGGVMKLDKFREEFDSTVESLSDVEDVAVSSE